MNGLRKAVVAGAAVSGLLAGCGGSPEIDAACRADAKLQTDAIAAYTKENKEFTAETLVIRDGDKKPNTDVGVEGPDHEFPDSTQNIYSPIVIRCAGKVVQYVARNGNGIEVVDADGARFFENGVRVDGSDHKVSDPTKIGVFQHDRLIATTYIPSSVQGYASQRSSGVGFYP